MEADIDRLSRSVDRLGDIVAGLQEGMKQQAEQTRALAERQAADFRSLLTMLHENYAKLIDRQDIAFKGFSDRLDKLVDRQDKLVERQDSHFRWLAGLIVASATSAGIALVKLH